MDTNTEIISNRELSLYEKYANASYEQLEGKVFISNKYRPNMDITATETIIYLKNNPDPVKGIGANTGTVTIAGGKFIIRNPLDARTFLEVVKAVPGYFREYNVLAEIENKRNKELDELMNRIASMDIPESKKAMIRAQIVFKSETQPVEEVQVAKPVAISVSSVENEAETAPAETAPAKSTRRATNAK